MRGKKTGSQVLEEIDAKPHSEERYLNVQRFSAKIDIRDITPEQKMQEASKPLYLKRYE
ncbi:MAG: hypothetical protein JSV05_00185 [Candidatus Bathyarchaeota archaeon]|nr:MAG: hypothetical protein JSV05_00185 [Candidatus Bathyarchaeota archaeon]